MAETTPTTPYLRNDPAIGTKDTARKQVGSYRIMRQLGVGGMGVVYVAEDTLLKREVALKVLHPDPSGDPGRKERFLREARATAALNHDHIVRIYHADEADGELYFVMELLKGESLHTRLKREHRLKLREAMQIARETAEGLVAAHQHGLIHRDITPANLWLEMPGRVKILDFGLVHVPDDTSLLSRLGAVMGTPGYMSPEQAAGEPVTAGTDLFSLGCVLYQMATGEKPFQGDSANASIRAVISENPRSPRQINPEIPEALDQLIVRLLEKAEVNRPASAQEVSDRLAELIDPNAPKRPSSASQMEKMVFGAIFGPDGNSAEVGTRSEAKQPTVAPEDKSGKPPYRLAPWLEHTIAVIVLMAGVIVLSLWWFHSKEKPPQNNPPASKANQGGQTSATDPNDLIFEVKPLDPKWVASLEKMTDPKERYEEVCTELKRRNPGLSGIRPFEAMEGTVRSLEIHSDFLEDLTPLRALGSLQNLTIRGSIARTGRLQNLEPLRGMGLVLLDVENQRVSNLAPLEGMTLYHLDIRGTLVTDLSPLRKLGELQAILVSEPIQIDLTPLRDIPNLESINGRPPQQFFKR